MDREVDCHGKKMTNCTQCPHHQVELDPDPSDWFNDDDVKVRCKLSLASSSKTSPDCVEPFVTVACRPYKVVEECDIPSWCPLLAKKADAA